MGLTHGSMRPVDITVELEQAKAEILGLRQRLEQTRPLVFMEQSTVSESTHVLGHALYPGNKGDAPVGTANTLWAFAHEAAARLTDAQRNTVRTLLELLYRRLAGSIFPASEPVQTTSLILGVGIRLLDEVHYNDLAVASLAVEALATGLRPDGDQLSALKRHARHILGWKRCDVCGMCGGH